METYQDLANYLNSIWLETDGAVIIGDTADIIDGWYDSVSEQEKPLIEIEDSYPPNIYEDKIWLYDLENDDFLVYESGERTGVSSEIGSKLRSMVADIDEIRKVEVEVDRFNSFKANIPDSDYL